MPWVWSACSWVKSTRVEPDRLGVEQLLAQIRRGVDQHAGRAAGRFALDQQRAAAAAVFRIVRIAGAPAERRPRHAARRAAAENREASGVMRRGVRRGTFENRRKKLSVVCRAISSAETPRASRQHLRGLDHIGRLVALAAIRPGARYGASVSTSRRSAGTSAAMSRRAPEFLKVRMPENDTYRPSSIAVQRQIAPAGEAMQHGREGALRRFPPSRIAPMSSSASRAWMTSGRPVSRAAAMCVRKPRSCASRGRVVVEIVEPGLADRDDLRMLRVSATRSAGRNVELPRAALCGCVPTEQIDVVGKRSAIASNLGDAAARASRS